jgi:hypothetical protein
MRGSLILSLILARGASEPLDRRSGKPAHSGGSLMQVKTNAGAAGWADLCWGILRARGSKILAETSFRSIGRGYERQ